MSVSDFSHFNADGKPAMVDVGEKPVSQRTALAAASVKVNSNTFELIRTGGLKKGDVLSVSQVAGIMGAKRTPDIIPLCHPIPIEGIDMRLFLDEEKQSVEIRAKIRTRGKTGVEMEALSAVSIAALTVYDMCKAVQKDIVIKDIRLIEKTGGVHGDYRDEADNTDTDMEKTGKIIAVCISPERGTQKYEVPEIRLIEDWGIENDAHAGKWHRQVSLLALDQIEAFRARGADVTFGAFGENIVTEGFDLKKMPIGTRFLIGENVHLELTQIGKECHSHCEIFKVMKDCIMPREGVFTRVLKGGTIRPGDTIKIIANDINDYSAKGFSAPEP